MSKFIHVHLSLLIATPVSLFSEDLCIFSREFKYKIAFAIIMATK